VQLEAEVQKKPRVFEFPVVGTAAVREPASSPTPVTREVLKERSVAEHQV